MSAQPIVPLTPDTAPLPRFEGQTVDASTIKISGLSALDDAEGIVVSTDDRVRIVGEFKVTGIRHYVDKDGHLVREQVLKPIRVETCPWDPTDVNDDGILRSRPLP